MEHLKAVIAEYAIPQADLESRVDKLTEQVGKLEDIVRRLKVVCQDLQEGYDISDCRDGHLVD